MQGVHKTQAELTFICTHSNRTLRSHKESGLRWGLYSVALMFLASPFYKDTGYIGLGAQLLQCDSVLTNKICNDSIST